MKITIDSTTLLLPSAGVKGHIYYWLRALMSEAPETGDIIETFPPGTPIDAVLDHREPTESVGAHVRVNFVRLLNMRGNPALDWVLAGSDLVHCSQHMARRPKGRPATATIFDLSCWTVPETHTQANIAATRRYADKILKSCDGLIANSLSARDDAVSILGIPEERIRVIYPGVAEPFFKATSADAEAVRTKYGLPTQYLLFVGCIEPRKNVRNIILAYGMLAEPTQAEVPLVLAGPFGWESADVRDLLATRRRNVRYLGYVPEQDMPGLVCGSVALVYPSYYEGFGLPAAQAMAAGVPVIASNRSSLPEVVGDAGILVNPDSLDELCEAMDRTVTCPAHVAELGARGRARATQFRWQAYARQSLEFFHVVADG